MQKKTMPTINGEGPQILKPNENIIIDKVDLSIIGKSGTDIFCSFFLLPFFSP